MAIKLTDVGRLRFKNPFRLVDTKPSTVELGAPGTIFFSGIMTGEEYNTDLQGEKALIVYDKMRRSDGQVKGALLACELPLRTAHWEVAPASDSTDDKRIAQYVQDNLMEGMLVTWDDFLHHILIMLWAGFSVFEKVWELEDGLYKWRKFAPRLPKTIYKWNTDAEGGLESIEQRVYKASIFTTLEIPIEKALVFTNEKEGSNYQGTSILRAAYKHWYFKNQLYAIDGIAAERHGVGLAVFHYPSNTKDSDKEKVKEIGERLHAHERAYISLPDDVGFDLKGVAGQLHDIKGSIEHHDLQITRSILAQFINLGGGEYGSYALSQDQSGFFLMALLAVAQNVASTINRYGIKQLVDYNWDVKKPPRLVVSDLEFFDIGTYTKAIADLAGAGALLPDAGVEDELRRKLHLPIRKRPASPTTASERRKVALAEWSAWRPLRRCETHVAFNEINDKLNSAEEEFVKAAQAVQTMQIRSMVNTLTKHIEDGNVAKVTDIGVPDQNLMENALSDVLLEMYDYGKDEVKKEARKQGATLKAQESVATGSAEGKVQFIKAKAKAIVGILAAKLQAAAGIEALRQIKAGAPDRAALIATLTVLSDRELKTAAMTSVAEALNLGRQEQAQEMADQIDHVDFSALLDEGTCGPCETLDGTTYDFPSAEWDEVNPPYKACEGQDRCRCIGVFVFKTEVPAVR